MEIAILVALIVLNGLFATSVTAVTAAQPQQTVGQKPHSRKASNSWPSR